MPRIERPSLLSLEAYAKERAEFRAKVIAHKKNRTVHVGPNVTLLFEDELTIRYQIQEMLRVERIFEEAEIHAELDTYNPLVPDGANWKVTMPTASTIQINYILEIDPGGTLPAWAANIFAEKGPFATFTKLGERLR